MLFLLTPLGEQLSVLLVVLVTQAGFLLSTPALALFDPDKYPVTVSSRLVSSTFSSPFYKISTVS